MPVRCSCEGTASTGIWVSARYLRISRRPVRWILRVRDQTVRPSTVKMCARNLSRLLAWPSGPTTRKISSLSSQGTVRDVAQHDRLVCHQFWADYGTLFDFVTREAPAKLPPCITCSAGGLMDRFDCQFIMGVCTYTLRETVLISRKTMAQHAECNCPVC